LGPLKRANLNHWTTHAEVKVVVKLQPTVSRPVSLGARRSSGTHDNFFFLLEIFFRQLRVCYFVAPSLTRGRVCNLLMLLVLASAVGLVSDYRGTQDHILLSQFLSLPQPRGPGPRIYIPLNRAAQIYLRALGWTTHVICQELYKHLTPG
jgi:hypothetical protein